MDDRHVVMDTRPDEDNQGSIQCAAEVLSSALNSNFTEFIGSLCHKHITFWNCVRVSGQLQFNIDDSQFITINISEVLVFGDANQDRNHAELEHDVPATDLQEAAKASLNVSEHNKNHWKKGKDEKVIGKGGKAFANKKVMRSHQCAATGCAKYACNVCSKTFTTLSTLYHHKRGLHESVKPYCCHLCPKTFSFHHSLKLHILKHEGRRPHQCSICQKSYLTSNHLKNHISAIHGDVHPFHCSVCQKTFPYENSLKSHMLLHSGIKSYLCGSCGKTFTTNTALRNHEQTHLERVKNHECDVCHKKYKSEMLLKAHKRRHTSLASRFVCDICGHAFMYKSNLDAHFAVHGDERRFKCTSCGKSFKTPATLHSHHLVHRVDAPFQCKDCSKSFKSKERLIAHEKRHSGDKPYQCDLCGHCFPDKGGLTKHRKTVHSSMKKFACPVCNKTCSRADNLRTHMKIHNDPSLLALSHTDLLMPDVPKQRGQLSSVLSGDISPVYAVTNPVLEQIPAPGASNSQTSEFNTLQLQQAVSNQILIGEETTGSSLPLLFQVGQN